MSKTILKRIENFVNQCLRKILGILWIDKVSNNDFWHRTNQVRIEIDILKRIWGWLGHTLRKPNTNITRQALTWNPKEGGNRKTPSNVNLRQTSRKRGWAGNNWRGSPRTGDVEEKLCMAYAPGGAKGLNNYSLSLTNNTNTCSTTNLIGWPDIECFNQCIGYSWSITLVAWLLDNQSNWLTRYRLF